jgi:hypothetical protein
MMGLDGGLMVCVGWWVGGVGLALVSWQLCQMVRLQYRISTGEGRVHGFGRIRRTCDMEGQDGIGGDDRIGFGGGSARCCPSFARDRGGMPDRSVVILGV